MDYLFQEKKVTLLSVSLRLLEPHSLLEMLIQLMFLTHNKLTLQITLKLQQMTNLLTLPLWEAALR